MNDGQTRRLNASQAGTGEMDANSTVWSSTASVSNKVTAIKASQVIIINQNNIQSLYRGGVRDSKKNAKADAGAKAFSMARVLYVFAEDTGNTVLKGEMDVPKYKFTKGKDTTLVQLWSLVYDRANTNSAALATGEYLIGATDITGLQSLINGFVGWKPKPVMGKAEKKAATIAINAEDILMKKNINLMLDAIAPWALSNPIFYNKVQDAFEVLDSGNRHIANWFNILDDLTGVRLDKVEAINVDLALTKKSSKRGVVRYMYEETGNGNYSYTFKKPGYKDYTISGVKSEEGKMNKIEIRMTKL